MSCYKTPSNHPSSSSSSLLLLISTTLLTCTTLFPQVASVKGPSLSSHIPVFAHDFRWNGVQQFWQKRPNPDEVVTSPAFGNDGIGYYHLSITPRTKVLARMAKQDIISVCLTKSTDVENGVHTHHYHYHRPYPGIQKHMVAQISFSYPETGDVFTDPHTVDLKESLADHPAQIFWFYLSSHFKEGENWGIVFHIKLFVEKGFLAVLGWQPMVTAQVSLPAADDMHGNYDELDSDHQDMEGSSESGSDAHLLSVRHAYSLPISPPISPAEHDFFSVSPSILHRGVQHRSPRKSLSLSSSSTSSSRRATSDLYNDRLLFFRTADMKIVGKDAHGAPYQVIGHRNILGLETTFLRDIVIHKSINVTTGYLTLPVPLSKNSIDEFIKYVYTLSISAHPEDKINLLDAAVYFDHKDLIQKALDAIFSMYGNGIPNLLSRFCNTHFVKEYNVPEGFYPNVIALLTRSKGAFPSPQYRALISQLESCLPQFKMPLYERGSLIS